MSETVFFASAEAWRSWLDRNHATAADQWVGLHKVASGNPGISYKEAVDAALAYGWIDATRRSIDEARWQIRFTPRKKGSIWSAVNIRRIGELKALGLMHPAGLKAFETRDPNKQNRYSFENHPTLTPAYEKKFRANKKAWAYFESRPPSYRRPAIWWVVSAKKEETREKRLAILIADSEAGRKIEPLQRPAERQME